MRSIWKPRARALSGILHTALRRFTSGGDSNLGGASNPFEPEEYRTLFLQNLPPLWTLQDLEFRISKIGKFEKVHIVRNRLGESTGQAIVVFKEIQAVKLAISSFKNRIPFELPVQARFYRRGRYPSNRLFQGKVLKVGNLPQELLRKDLKEFVDSIAPCIHVAYLRSHDDEFMRKALVYFYTEEEAHRVMKVVQDRYVLNHRLRVKQAERFLDISDFRHRIEFDVKVNLPTERFLAIQHIRFIEDFVNRLQTSRPDFELLRGSEFEKLEYNQFLLRRINKRIGLEGGGFDCVDFDSPGGGSLDRASGVFQSLEDLKENLD